MYAMIITEASKANLIGTRGHYRTGDLDVEATITDVRSNFGRVDVLIMPVRGKGEQWVNADRFTPYEKGGKA